MEDDQKGQNRRLAKKFKLEDDPKKSKWRMTKKIKNAKPR